MNNNNTKSTKTNNEEDQEVEEQEQKEEFVNLVEPVQEPIKSVKHKNLVKIVKKKPVEWSYNNMTERSYVENDLKKEIPEYLDLQERRFLSKVSTNPKYGYKIEREITRMVRCNVLQDGERKDYLVWYENWYGKDWQGREIAPVADHVQGKYMEQQLEPVVERNEVVGSVRGRERVRYYVPFSKKKVDEIIASSNGKSDKDSIKWVVVNSLGPRRSGQYSYDQFVNMKHLELVELQNKQGGPTAHPYDKKQSQYS